MVSGVDRDFSKTDPSIERDTETAVGSTASAIANYFGQMRLFWIFLGLFFIASIIASQVYQDGIMDGVWLYGKRIIMLALFISMGLVIVIPIMLLMYRTLFNKGNFNEACFGSTFKQLKAILAGGTLFLQFAMATLTFMIFMGCFVYWKEKIGEFNPFSWDETFAAWVAALFSGKHAWEVFHPYLGHYSVTKIVDTLYWLWVPLCAFYWIIVFINPKLSDEEKHQYLFTNLISWVVIGLFVATYFASGGPVYYGQFTGNNELYSGLMDYLSTFDFIDENGQLQSHLIANSGHRYLWAVYTGAIDMPGGISAMPSMHVAQATLFVLITYKLSRLIGHLMVLFWLSTFLGSFHLAWHYAVDGLISAPLAVIIWFTCGWLTGAYRQQTPPEAV